MVDPVDRLLDPREQQVIELREAQLQGAADREELGLAIKHESVATIRKAGDTISLTQDQLMYVLSEIKKCRDDIIYFAEKYFRIIGDGGLQLIKLYPKQKELLKAMQRESRLVCLASRQCGKSTTYTIYFLWLAMFFPDRKIAIAAHQFATAEEILSRIKLAYEYLPKEIKPAAVAYSNKQVLFDNNSEIRAFATGGNSLAGFSFDCVALDEAALWPASVAETFFTTTMPILSSRKNSKAIMVSTPRGTVNNKFYDIWSVANSVDIKQNKDGWVPFRIDWWDVPGRDEAWKDAQIATMGAERFRQEFGNEFTASGEALLIPDELILKFRRALDSYPRPIAINLSDDENKPINGEVWKEYLPGHTYIAGADVSEGTGNDASVLYILDATNLKNGVHMAAKITCTAASVLDFANACSKLLKQYNYPTVIVENNGVGSGFVENLIDTFKVPAERVFSETKKSGEVRRGIHSTNGVKLEAALFTRELLTTEEIPFTIPDKFLVDEMATFIRKVNSSSITYRASGKTHDDHIMSFIWCLYLLHYKNIENYYRVAEAFKTKQGQVLPAKLEMDDLEDPKEILGSELHKIIVTLLNNGSISSSPDLLSKSSTPVAAGDDPSELYYGAAGRGGSNNAKQFFFVKDDYTRFDTVEDDEDDWEDGMVMTQF